MKLQWFGPPGPRQMIDRHHRTVAPLAMNGRLFVPGNDRVIAVDAYNGTMLWNVTFPNSRRVGVFRDCSYVVAADDSLYVAAGPKCHEVDAATGEIKRTFDVPAASDGVKREWGYLASSGDLLFGSRVKPGASRRGHSRVQILEGTYYDSRPLVCSDMVFASDRATGKLNWGYHPSSGTIINSTITVGDGYVFFIESTNKETLETPTGRSDLAELLDKGSSVVALDVRDGSTAWSKPHDLSAFQHAIYASYAQGKLAVVGSRNDGTDKEKSRVFFDVHVFDAETGEPVWFTTQHQGTKIDGSHGEQDHHPVIVGDKLYCEPYAYELHTGKPLAEWTWRKEHRRGCGTISASASMLFFRQANPTMFDLETNQYSKVTTVTRPGCWINMIPAGGLLLVPEASSGCTCNFAVQTSMAFLPVESSE
jgi:outer membrane protein assembly factor BamB